MHKRTVAADLIVNLPDTDECLEWPLYRRGMGYGQVYYEGKLWRAHVLSWTLHRGVIPEGLIVCHECDNPPCYNPLHLFVGTAADNARDMVRKGRHANGYMRGYIHPPKHSDALIEQAMREYREGSGGYRKIAAKFGIPTSSLRDRARAMRLNRVERGIRMKRDLLAKKAVLVYQLGCANVFSVDRFSLNAERRNAIRMLQGSFEIAEAFARGLLAAGAEISCMACSIAGDISGAEWTHNLQDAPFYDQMHPILG